MWPEKTLKQNGELNIIGVVRVHFHEFGNEAEQTQLDQAIKYRREHMHEKPSPPTYI